MTDKKAKGLDIASLIIKIAFLGILLGFVLTLLTLLIPITVESHLDVEDMGFGKPFPYLIQSFSGVPYEDAFPIKCIPKFTDRYTTEIDIWAFVASFALNSVLGIAVVIGIRYLKNRKSVKKEPSSEPEIKDGFAVTEAPKDGV